MSGSSLSGGQRLRIGVARAVYAYSCSVILLDDPFAALDATTAGSSGYLFWNQSGKYGHVSNAWRRQIVPHILTPKPAM